MGNKASTPPPPPRAGFRYEIWIWLLGGVLVVSILEWATYHRRVTV